MLMILTIGAPVVVLYLFLFPGFISFFLIRQRKKKELYPHQKFYKPRWTIRLGFMFAGYREGFEWWESVVLVRKALVFLLSIFLKSYGTTPQVVAAGMVLVIALSFHLQYQPYQAAHHNWIESISLHTCLVQILVVLMGNMIGRVHVSEAGYELGPVSSLTIIVTMFTTTILFFWQVCHSTVKNSQSNIGAVGAISRSFNRRLPSIFKPAGISSVRNAGSVPVAASNKNTDSSGSNRYSGANSKVSSTVPMLGAIGRQATRRGSLKYNVKVLQHMKKTESGIKDYHKTMEQLKNKVVAMKGKSNSRLQQRLKIRRRESMLRNKSSSSTRVFPAGKNDELATSKDESSEKDVNAKAPKITATMKKLPPSGMENVAPAGTRGKAANSTATTNVVVGAHTYTATKRLPPSGMVNVAAAGTRGKAANSTATTNVVVGAQTYTATKRLPPSGMENVAAAGTRTKTANTTRQATKNVAADAKANTAMKKLPPSGMKNVAAAGTRTKTANTTREATTNVAADAKANTAMKRLSSSGTEKVVAVVAATGNNATKSSAATALRIKMTKKLDAKKFSLLVAKLDKSHSGTFVKAQFALIVKLINGKNHARVPDEVVNELWQTAAGNGSSHISIAALQQWLKSTKDLN